MNNTLSPTPTSMPISKANTRQQMNVPKPGIKSLSIKISKKKKIMNIFSNGYFCIFNLTF